MFDPSWDADAHRKRRKQRRRNPGRYLAPLALVAVIAGAYVIVQQGIKQDTQTHTVTQPVVHHLTKSQRRYAHARFYTVKAGENLIGIAAKTGVPLTRIEALNRHLNPSTLQPGQRLRLRS
jgi:LysM repeat protein